MNGLILTMKSSFFPSMEVYDCILSISLLCKNWHILYCQVVGLLVYLVLFHRKVSAPGIMQIRVKKVAISM